MGFSWLLLHRNEKYDCVKTLAEESDPDPAGVSGKPPFLNYLDGGNCPSQTVKYHLFR